jgi:hypothetical protein
MARNPFKDSILSEYALGIDVVPRRIVPTRSEELATIRGHWLHKVSASDFEAAQQQAMKAAAKNG